MKKSPAQIAWKANRTSDDGELLKLTLCNAHFFSYVAGSQSAESAIVR